MGGFPQSLSGEDIRASEFSEFGFWGQQIAKASFRTPKTLFQQSLKSIILNFAVLRFNSKLPFRFKEGKKNSA